MIKLYDELHNEIPLKSFVFSGGEVQVRILETDLKPQHIYIHANLTNSDEIMKLAMVTNALWHRFGPWGDLPPITLICPYLPYARQDRVCYPGEADGIGVMAAFLNSFGFHEIVVWDVHSPVAEKHIRRLRNITASELLYKIYKNVYEGNLQIANAMLPANPICVAPDKGAIERTQLVADEVFLGEAILADKVRDPNDGKIIGIEVQSGHVGDRDLLIIDDICDGGRTFIELAKKLKPLTNGRIGLYVTHGIFSQGFEVFDGLIDFFIVANLFPKHLENIPNNMIVGIVGDLT